MNCVEKMKKRKKRESVLFQRYRPVGQYPGGRPA